MTMKIQKYIYLLFIAVCIAIMGIYGFRLLQKNSGKKSPSLPQTEFKLAKEIIDLGDVKQHVPANALFAIQNTGKHNLLLESVTPDCHCTAAEWDKNPVPPGGTAFVKTAYDSEVPGVFQKLIKVTANIPDSPIILIIRGNVVFDKGQSAKK
jgi:hypothetical protein